MALRFRTDFPDPNKQWQQTNVLEGNLAVIDTDGSPKTINKTSAHIDPLYEVSIDKPPYIYRSIGQRWSNRSPSQTDLGIQTQVTRRAADISRIAQWMVSGEGVVWNIAQAGLQLSQPKLETIDSPLRTRIYNPIKLMANVGLTGTGARFTRFGLTPDDYNYGRVQRDLRDQNQMVSQDIYSSSNRLVKLGLELNKFQLDSNATANEDKEISKFGTVVKNISSFLQKIGLKQSGEPIELISGPGGPKSLFGIGWTDFFKSNHGVPLDVSQQYFQSKQGATRYAFKEYNDQTRYVGFQTIDADFGILKGTNTLEMYNSNEQPGDYQGGLTMIPSADLNDYNKYIDLNDASNKFESEKRYLRRKQIQERDKINNPFTIDLFKKNEFGRNIADSIYTDAENNDEPDFIKFRFTRDGERLQFRATLTAIADSFQPEWGETRYIGRPDSTYVYKGIKRNISFTFIIPILHKDERDGMWAKTNRLAQFVSPKLQNGRMTGPIIYLQIGDYLNSKQNQGQPGYISSLEFSIEDDYPWDLDNKKPMYIKVSVNFQFIGVSTPSDSTVYFGS